MAHLNYKKSLPKELKDEALRLLLRKLNSISQIEALEIFLDSFTSRRERETLLRGLASSVLFARGVKYRDIKENLEISGNTISKMNELINGKRRRLRAKDAPARPATKYKKKIIWPKYKGTRGLGLFE